MFFYLTGILKDRSAKSRAISRGDLCWVSPIFRPGLASEVMGCAADDFPVKDSLKVGLRLSFVAKCEEETVDTTRRGLVSLMAHWGAGGHRMRSGHSTRASPGIRLPCCL